MKLIASAFCIAALCSAGLVAQESETHSRQKVEVKDGKKVTLTGCVQESPDGMILTDINHGRRHSYLLVGHDEDVAKLVGERVEVRGKAADRDHGKVKIEKKDKDGDRERKSETAVEGTGGSVDLPLLGVDNVKRLSGSCR